MRRRFSPLALAAALGTSAVVAGLGTNPVGASAPDQQGWWTTLNQGSAPEVGLPVSAPTPPDVPAQGLLVEGPSNSEGPSSNPVAYAGLVYYLPAGASASTLTLTVATNSATTPMATLELCPLVNPVLNPEQEGPSADAPPFDCTHNVTAAPNAAGSTYQFEVSQLVTAGSLAVAILPTQPSDRVVFDQPDANSLAVQSPAASSEPQTQSPSPGPTPITALEAPIPEALPTFGITQFGATLSPTYSGVPAPSTPPAPPAPSAPAEASPRSYSAIPVLGVFNGDNASPLVVALVLAGLSGGAALWFITGRRRADEGEVAVID